MSNAIIALYATLFVIFLEFLFFFYEKLLLYIGQPIFPHESERERLGKNIKVTSWRNERYGFSYWRN